MDIRNSATLGTIGNTPVVQFNNIFPSGINSFAHLDLPGDSFEVELTEDNYCPLPEYCLIEDKWKYLAGLM